MISVVMPAYNAADFIRPAVESILNQTYPDLELIVVDDGSSDDTLDILHEYAAADSRVRVIAKQHAGVSAALNTGLREARFPYIAIMHADDIAHLERLSKQIAAAESDPDVVLWGTNGYHINSRGQILSKFKVGPASKAESDRLRARGEIVQAIHPTILMRRETALAAGGYDSEFDAAEDIEFFDRMLAFGPLVTLQEPLLMYRVHSSSLTMMHYHFQSQVARYIRARQAHRLKTGEELAFETFRQITMEREGPQALQTSRADRARLYYRHAGMAVGERHFRRGMGYFLLALINNPFYAIPRLWTQTIQPGLSSFIGGHARRIFRRRGT